MSLRFRQTFTLFPGVRLNIGKRGISASIGVPGATVNVGKKGLEQLSDYRAQAYLILHLPCPMMMDTQLPIH
ncbi:Uncharacterised protein [Escherichia coli]|uniref:DUF4236 domain-containing protein n=1 Tax=Escherichia coli TaxID=562 RepID=A0A376TD82_ECOLX|nr:Uncharacterised protein [Escherichia coli]